VYYKNVLYDLYVSDTYLYDLYVSHSVPLFISSKTLPLNMLFPAQVLSVVFYVSSNNTPPNITDLFNKASGKHGHETRFSSLGNFYIRYTRLN